VSEYFGRHERALILIHGGAGSQDPCREEGAKAIASLKEIAAAGMTKLQQGQSRQDVATFCLSLLEDDPQFNAGLGAALQADGMARLSAALMDGSEQTFSGVIGAQYLKNPSLLVAALQSHQARTLTGPGIDLLARQLGVPIGSVLTERRVSRWLKTLAEHHYEPFSSYDTVGVVVRDEAGNLTAAASTGGRGFEYPGRVSDTPTVAGTYASAHAAICVTGYGEQIVDDAVAARLETRVRDGLGLEAACRKTFAEATSRRREYGWIAANRDSWAACYTTSFMPFAVWGTKGLVAQN
jgi:L-asparaginase